MISTNRVFAVNGGLKLFKYYYKIHRDDHSRARNGRSWVAVEKFRNDDKKVFIPPRGRDGEPTGSTSVFLYK